MPAWPVMGVLYLFYPLIYAAISGDTCYLERILKD
jgi:hypothetical protein